MPEEGEEMWAMEESSDEVDKARDHSTAPPTSGPEANRQVEENKQPRKVAEEFTRTMEKEVSDAIPHAGDQPPTICVVPGDLAEGNMKAYTPTAVCIGPFFYSQRNTPALVKLQRYKLCCVRSLIVGRRQQPPAPAPVAAWMPEVHVPVLHRCLQTMVDLVPRIRACYAGSGGEEEEPELRKMLQGSTEGEAEELARAMLLDGCFVLHRLLRHTREEEDKDEDDGDWTQVFGRCWIWGMVTRDLLLLENQIPFFVVQALFEQLQLGTGAGDVLVEGGLQLFRSLHPRPRPAGKLAVPSHQVHHLLHLYHLSVDLPASPATHRRGHELPAPELTQWVPCAKELQDAGVRFRARKHAASFLDVGFHFRDGVLEIPAMQLYDYSETLLRNLVAFEQTYPATAGRVTAYAIFMDCLVKTPEDMRLLHRRGIMVNNMNGEMDASKVFSRVCAEAHTSPSRNYLAAVMEDVVTYQSARRHQWRAVLVRDYFPNPWVAASVVAAAILLVFTTLQTFFSVYAYYKPPSS